MNFNKKLLILGSVLIFVSIMGVYSAQYHQNTDDINNIIENANGEDVYGCCSIVLQLDGNNSIMSFRRDSNYTADIHVEKVNWHGMPAIKQYKEDEGYFNHVIITSDGWMIGMGGIDDGADSEKCENISAKMITKDYKINKSYLKQIQKIKKPYGRGHMVIKAPNGNYGFVNVDKLKTGKLSPGQYISIPNQYSLSRSGDVSLKTDDLVKEMVELSQLDKYGEGRRDIVVYDFHSYESNNTTDIYVANEDGSKLGIDYTKDVDDIYVQNNLTKASDIPIAPDYKFLDSITFNNDSNNLLVYGILIGAVIFIAALSYGVYRFMRFIKSRMYR